MYNRKVYDPEFKLNVVKEYLNGDKSQAQICEEYSISPSMFFKWLKKYTESGYDDSVFNVKKGRPESIISDYSKIPPFIFESEVYKSRYKEFDDKDHTSSQRQRKHILSFRFKFKIKGKEEKFVKNLLKILLELLFSFQDLTKNKILIIDTTPYSGSSGYALYKFLKKMNDCYEVELFQEDKSKRIQNYLKRILKVKGAAVVISTHGIPCLLKRKKQIVIELWHGIPFKAMGLLDKSLDLRSKKLTIKLWNKVDFIVSSSVTYSTLINACLGTYNNPYVITGFPRNDYLFDNGRLQELSLKNGKELRGKRVILFVPTFRKGYINRIEGVERDKNVFGFEEFDMKAFNNFLKENRALLIVKLHPFEEEFYKKVYEKMNLSNFYFLTSEILESSKIDLYEILPDVDLLITDYSSIYFDFLLLNKPIIFVKPDFEQYSKIRGVLLSPYDFWTPGPKVTSQDDLEKSISEIFSGKDNYAERRKELKDIFFEHQDGNSSERILQVIKDKLSYFK